MSGSDNRVASLKPDSVSKQTFIYKTKENNLATDTTYLTVQFTTSTNPLQNYS